MWVTVGVSVKRFYSNLIFYSATKVQNYISLSQCHKPASSSSLHGNRTSDEMALAVPFGHLFASLPGELAGRVVQHLPPSAIFHFSQTCRAALNLVRHNPLCWRYHLPSSLLSPTSFSLHETALAIARAPRNRPYAAANFQGLSFAAPNDSRGEGVVVVVPAGNAAVTLRSADASVEWENFTAVTGLEGAGSECFITRNLSVVDWRSTLHLPRGTYAVSVNIGATGVWRLMENVLVLVYVGGVECGRVVGHSGRLIQKGFRRLDLGEVGVSDGDAVEVQASSDSMFGCRELRFGTVEAVRCGGDGGRGCE